ncbi:MAG: SulP family inorganic anion transporter, partial [Ktedonobacterales bacterium]
MDPQLRSHSVRKGRSDIFTALLQVVPGVIWIRAYRSQWLRSDLIAGITIAAVSLPIGMAYGQLAGLSPIAGVYASMLPLVAYALVGSSKLLIVGPDASSAALVAAAVGTLAEGSAARYAGLAALLAIETGLICLAAGVARLGFIASFLSKPILVGYMNGLALTVIASQLPNVLGIHVTGSGFVAQVGQILTSVGSTHLVTLSVGAGTLVVIWALQRVAPRLPGSLVAVAGATIAVALWHLDTRGVPTVGAIAPGLPALGLPVATLSDATHLLGDALGIALLTYSDTILNARSFAVRSGDHVRSNQEFIGLSIADILAGISRGLPVSGSGTRTAVSEAAGGKTQLVGIVAAVALAVMLLFLSGPLSLFPTAALGAVLIAAAARLFDIDTLRLLAHADQRELAVALVTLVGVLAVGLLQGIVLAIGLSFLLLLARAVRPHDAVLGQIKGVDGFHDLEEYPQGATIPGLIVYRFDAQLFFANADVFQRRVRSLVAKAGGETLGAVEWFVLDAEAIG